MTASSFSPYLIVRGADAALAFYKSAFGAAEHYRLIDPADGRIGHAEFALGGVTFMLADEYPDFGAVGPEAIGGSPVKLQIYVADADAVLKRALSLGATEVRPVKDQFFGDRSGMLTDPFGHSWTIATKVSDVAPAEMQARWNAAMEG